MIVRNQERRGRRAAFTLMEMMIVVAIILALAGMAVFFMAGQADEGNKARVKASIKQLTDAVIIYKAQHAGQWPQDLTTLMQRDAEGHGPYVRSEEDLKDPWNNFYKYDPAGANNNGLHPDIYSETPYGIIGNWAVRK